MGKRVGVLMSKIMEDFFSPYSIFKIMTLHSFLLEMARYGLTAEDVLAGCTARIQEHISATTPPADREAAPEASIPTAACPDCGALVRVSRVNVSRCTNIGGPWKSSIECLNKTCRYTELSIKTMNDWRK